MAIALHPEVEVTITLNIARSAEEAERQAKGETLTTAEAIYGDDINENARPENVLRGRRRRPDRGRAGGSLTRSFSKAAPGGRPDPQSKVRTATSGLFLCQRKFSLFDDF